MRIPLELGGLAATIDGLNSVADAFERVAEAKASATDATDASLVGQIDAIGGRHYLGRGTLSDPNATQPLTHSAVTRRIDPAVDLSKLIGELIEVNRSGFTDLNAQFRSSGSRGGGGGSRQGRGPTGGLANLQQREQELQEAVRSGDNSAIRDARVRLAQAQRRVQREDRMMRGSSFADRLMELLGTTRIGLGGGQGVQISPLVNRVGRLFGDSGGSNGAAGPVGVGVMAFLLSIAAATAATKFFVDAIQQATIRGKEFAVAGTTTGGSPRDIARLGAFGLSAGRGGQLAEQIYQGAISQQGRTGMARLGLGQVSSSPYAQVNRAELATRVLGALERETDLNKQLAVARMFGLQGMLDELRVSESVRKSRRQEAADRERVFNPKFTQQSRDLAAQLEVMNGSFGNMLASFSGPLMGDAITTTQLLTMALQGAVPVVRELGEQVHRAFNFIAEAGIRFLAQLKYPFDPAKANAIGNQAIGEFRRMQQQNTNPNPLTGGGRQNPMDWKDLNKRDFQGATAQAANLQALVANTNALVALRGEFGGVGGAARGAVPPAFLASDPGSAERKFLEMQAFRLGHFA